MFWSNIICPADGARIQITRSRKSKLLNSLLNSHELVSNCYIDFLVKEIYLEDFWFSSKVFRTIARKFTTELRFPEATAKNEQTFDK